MDASLITGEKGAINYMPQSSSLLQWRTVLDNVVLGAGIAGNSDQELALDMIQKAGLSGYEHAYPHQLSGGDEVTGVFYSQHTQSSTLICLDEAFSALDEFTRLEMQDWLLSIWEHYHRSIIFVTHNIEEALYLSDRLIVLSDQSKKEFSIPFPRPRKQSLMLTQ